MQNKPLLGINRTFHQVMHLIAMYAALRGLAQHHTTAQAVVSRRSGVPYSPFEKYLTATFAKS